MTGSHRFGIETVRDAARQRAAQTSLRHVADEIGLSYGGLRSFLISGTPQAATLEKLMSWYAAMVGGRRAKVSVADVKAAIALLREHLDELPEPTRSRRRREIIQELED